MHDYLRSEGVARNRCAFVRGAVVHKRPTPPARYTPTNPPATTHPPTHPPTATTATTHHTSTSTHRIG